MGRAFSFGVTVEEYYAISADIRYEYTRGIETADISAEIETIVKRYAGYQFEMLGSTMIDFVIDDYRQVSRKTKHMFRIVMSVALSNQVLTDIDVSGVIETSIRTHLEHALRVLVDDDNNTELFILSVEIDDSDVM